MMMPSEQHDWRRQAYHNGTTSLIPGQVLKHTQPAWKGLTGSYARTRVQSCRVQSQSCQPVRIPADLLVTSLAWSNQIFCLPKTRQVRLTQRPEWVEPLPAATRQAWLTKNAYPCMLVHHTWIGSSRKTPKHIHTRALTPVREESASLDAACEKDIVHSCGVGPSCSHFIACSR